MSNDERNAYQRAWRKANPDKVAAQNKRNHSRNPDAKQRAYQKWAAIHREQKRLDDKIRSREYRKTEAYQEFKVRRQQRRLQKLESVAGRPRPTDCELCGDSSRRIVFDHCHENGMFRGWICDLCNKALGHAKDDPALLHRMAAYIEAASKPS